MYYSSLDNMDSNDVKNIYEIADLTIISFLINIFKIYNNISAQKFTSRSIKDNDLLEYILEITDLNAILEFIKKYSDSDKDYKILKMYYDMYKAIKNTDNSDFYYEFKNNV
ncbi:MAG TPA: hypothetical protein PKD83_10900, partial [Ignavibacteria bacterium]|nr:hypothetical protein [Ignavibacteria bacterium]